MKQRSLFEANDAHENELRDQRSGSFVDNMQLPVHRWFRYSAGFSAEWAGELIREAASTHSLHVFDPFAGSGTVLLEAERAGVLGIGIEAHPFVARIAEAKTYWREDPNVLRELGTRIVSVARKTAGSSQGYAPLIAKCYPPETLLKLDSLKNAWDKTNDGSPLAKLCWLALVSILRVTSSVGTAPWQYILPKKAKTKRIDPFMAFEERIRLLAFDMASWQTGTPGPSSKVLCEDARECSNVPSDWADLIITSPPYANNYDYADATRLEMTFFREINGWGDLQASVRSQLVRSCTQHVAPYASQTLAVLDAPSLMVIRDELSNTCLRLEREKENHGGKKQYHAMIAHYFLDLAEVWKAVRRVLKPGGKACFVVGDSAPYGIHVPVDRWLGELAVAAGFKGYRFEKLRDRNTKWKNRKHRVPLHEGQLWVEG